MRVEHIVLLIFCFVSNWRLGVGSGLLQTCDQQYACVTWTLSDPLPAKRCTSKNCEFQVCLTANFTGDCLLASEPGNSAQIDNACGNLDGCPQPQTSTGWNQRLKNGDQICQYGPGGGDLLFVMQDSLSCNYAKSYTPFYDPALTASCSAEGAQGVCNNRNGECVWRVLLPDCPAPSPSASKSPSRSASLSRSPARTPSMSRSPSQSRSPSRSPSPSVSEGWVAPAPAIPDSPTPSPSAISTSPSRSPSPSRSVSRSQSLSRSPARSPSPSASPSPIACVDVPNWQDSNGITCKQYVDKNWCFPNRTYGPRWTGGNFTDRAVNGMDATQACCGCGKDACVTDTILVVDKSGSIADNWPLVVQYLHNRVNGTRFTNALGNRIGIVTYSTYTQMECPLLWDLDSLEACINNIVYTGGFTFTADAIDMAGSLMDTYSLPDRRRVIEVITDGLSDTKVRTQNSAATQKSKGVTMLAIGVGTDANSDELMGIASEEKVDHWANLGTWAALGYLARIITSQCTPLIPGGANFDWLSSPSPEASWSPSPTPLPSPSPATSQSRSPSPSRSTSRSQSPVPSDSASASASRSPSLSPGASSSPSLSPGASSSPSSSSSPYASPSESPSPSPVRMTATSTMTPTGTETASDECANVHAQVPDWYVYTDTQKNSCSPEDILRLLDGYACQVSSADCGVVVCDKHVPPELVAQLNSQC